MVQRISITGRSAGHADNRILLSGTLPVDLKAGSIEPGTLARARFSESSRLIGTRHVAQGSQYGGAWEAIGQYQTKTYVVQSTMSGSLRLIAGGLGSGVNGLTGTLYGFRLGQGTYRSFSFTESFAFIKPIVVVGSIGSGKGTLSLGRIFQV